MQLRLYLMVHVESDEYWESRFPRLVNYGVGERLNFRSIKLIADGASAPCLKTRNMKLVPGALGSFGAALLEPVRVCPTSRC